MEEPNVTSSTAIVVLYPGCTLAEVIELATRLVDAGLEVVHAAAVSEEFVDRSGLHVRPDVTIEELDPTTIDVVIVPGGDPETIINNRSVAGLLVGVARVGGLIAGICAGVLVMADAGVLRGRSITHNYRPPWAPDEISTFVERFWEGATVEPDPTVGVVVDDQIITALPNATIEFAVTVCHHLGLYDSARAAQVQRHLRGEYVAELYK